MRIPAPAVSAVRPLLRERIPRLYLGVVAAVLVLVALDTALVSHRQVSATAVLLMLLTLPWTPALWWVFTAAGGMDAYAAAYGWWGWTLTLLAAVVSATVNAVVLGWAARRARGRPPAR